MKGRVVQVLAGIVATIGVITSASGVSADQPAHSYYTALGDSVAVEQGARVPDQFGYAGIFKRCYRANHGTTERFANLAVPKESSSTFLDDQMAQPLEIINDPGIEIQVVTSNIGANDFLPLMRTAPCALGSAGVDCQQAVATPLRSFAGKYQAILTQLMCWATTRGRNCGYLSPL